MLTISTNQIEVNISVEISLYSVFFFFGILILNPIIIRLSTFILVKFSLKMEIYSMKASCMFYFLSNLPCRLPICRKFSKNISWTCALLSDLFGNLWLDVFSLIHNCFIQLLFSPFLGFILFHVYFTFTA